MVMYYLIRLWHVKLIIFISFASYLSDASATRIVASDLDWPPYLIANPETPDMPGLGKDIINHCAAKYQYHMRYFLLPIKRISLYMQHGEIDLNIYSYKEYREEFLVYSKVPIFNTEIGLVVRADSDIKIHSLDDLIPLRIGHLAGLTHTPELLAIIEKKRKAGELSEGHSLDAMFAQLLSSTPRFDIMPDSKQTLYWNAKQLGISDQIKVLPFVTGRKDYFITVSKKTKNIDNIEAFLNQFDQCIIQMHEDGRYDRLLKKYNLLH